VDDTQYELAVTGAAFARLKSEMPLTMHKILGRACVFARMSPQQKAELVEAYQLQAFTVGMCGDGANDCAALRAADVGLSLSEAEASVAAPFTSQQPTIAATVTLLKEGRCALASSIQIFKYMACYSLILCECVNTLYGGDKSG